MALSTDVFGLADCKSSSNKDVFAKETKSASSDQTDLTLNYVQKDLEAGGAKGRIKTTEHVFFNFRGNYNVIKASRNHHPGTTTSTDSINQIHNNNLEWTAAPKHVKEAIHGASGISDREKSLDGHAGVHIFVWEKSGPLCEDLLHHAGASGLLLASAGAGNWIIAAINCRVKVLALTKQWSPILSL